MQTPQHTPLDELLGLQAFYDALERVLVSKNLLACSWRELRLLINKELAGTAYVSQTAWEKLMKDEASPTTKLDERYQLVREWIELAQVEAKVFSMESVLDAKNYLDMQKHQWVMNTRFPGFGQEQSNETTTMSGVTIIMAPPAQLPLPPRTAKDLAEAADAIELEPLPAKIEAT